MKNLVSNVNWDLVSKINWDTLCEGKICGRVYGYRILISIQDDDIFEVTTYRKRLKYMSSEYLETLRQKWVRWADNAHDDYWTPVSTEIHTDEVWIKLKYSIIGHGASIWKTRDHLTLVDKFHKQLSLQISLDNDFWRWMDRTSNGANRREVPQAWKEVSLRKSSYQKMKTKLDDANALISEYRQMLQRSEELIGRLCNELKGIGNDKPESIPTEDLFQNFEEPAYPDDDHVYPSETNPDGSYRPQMTNDQFYQMTDDQFYLDDVREDIDTPHAKTDMTYRKPHTKHDDDLLRWMDDDVL